jgi:very-short-patch-repair endonuclease
MSASGDPYPSRRPPGRCSISPEQSLRAPLRLPWKTLFTEDSSAEPGLNEQWTGWAVGAGMPPESCGSSSPDEIRRSLRRSPLEDSLVALLHRAGLPEPVRQHWIAPPGRPPIRVDLAYPAFRLAIEAQSVAWHTGQADLQRDCDKQNLLVSLGWRLLEFTWADVHDRPDRVVDTVFSAVVAFGHAAGTVAGGWPIPSYAPSA